MKLFILFILFCGIFAADPAIYTNDPTENTVIPNYDSENNYVANCKEYNVVNEVQTTCKTCHTEFTKEPKCSASDVTNGPVSTSNGKFEHAEIGWDTKTGTCTKTINIVNANGGAISNDKYSGTKSCLACAEYTDDGTKCKICAAGYLENNGGCTPITANTFGSDETTNKYCVYGAYTGDGQNRSPQCYACSGNTILSGNKCNKAPNVDTHPDGCIRKELVKITVGTTDSYRLECRECRYGFQLVEDETFGFSCAKIGDNCLVIDNTKKCTLCMPGYFPSNGECSQCHPTMPNSLTYFKNDECNGIGRMNCECNPNCIQNPVNAQNCVSRHCDLFSEKEMSTVNRKNPKCLRCQQGYKLDANNECVECTNDCFTSAQKTTCEKGYYLANDGKGGKVCRKCEGKCVECVSKTQCVEGKIETRNDFYGHALNGLPCLDANCTLCSSEDPSICYKCRNDESILIGGKCYLKNKDKIAINGATVFVDSCRYYEQPAFITDRNAEVKYTNEYNYNLEPVYKRGSLNSFTNSNSNDGIDYLCKYRDFLPYYYRYYDNQLTCAGENRDPHNDCECIEGYYATDVTKTSKCEKTDVPYCKKAISKTLCAECFEGMIMYNAGSKSNPVFVCGCPETYQRINHNGVCVECPPLCASCQTENLSGNSYGTKCLTCHGKAEFSGEEDELKAANFNREPDNYCKCKDGYKSKTPESDLNAMLQLNRNNDVYGCYAIPTGCKESTGNYEVNEYSVTCKKCDYAGFTTVSQCTQCSVGYFRETDDQSSMFDKCVQCPTLDADTTESYCIECSQQNTCDKCVSEGLDLENNCITCGEGYSLVYVDIPDQIVSPVPKCIQNIDLCEDQGDQTCFVAPEGLNEAQLSAYSSKSKVNPYTQAEYDAAVGTYCRKCLRDGQMPHLGCACPDDKYRDDEKNCQSCAEKLGKQTFKTYDINGNEVEGKYEDVCQLSITTENTGNVLCEKPSYRNTIECKLCKNSERTASSNCLECESSTKFPVYDSTKGHICADCLEKCATCKNNKNCTSCKGVGVTGVDCDKCTGGFIQTGTDPNTGAALCTKCNEECGSCEETANKCISCSVENHIPGPNNDCKACADGYYYSITDNTCIEVDKTYGYSESIPICLKTDGTQIDCTEQNRNEIAEIKEKPVKCDTTLGVGISPYPVNDRCVCDTGYLDNRTNTDIDNDPIPQCVSVKEIGERDPFCIDAKFKDETKKSIICEKCNADYLEIDGNGKCKCKKTHYATRWGMCVPCGRHNKGCLECSGDNAKYFCDKCDESAYKLGGEEKDDKGNKVRKCVGK